MCELKARKQQKKRGKIPSFANRTLPTVVASLLANVTAAELMASPLRQRYTWLLAKLSQ
jgi:hypothetical protein